MYPSQQVVTLPGAGAVVSTALPVGDLTVTVGSNNIEVSAGWAVDGGGSIVAPVLLAARKFAAWERLQSGGATVVYVSSAVAGEAVLIIEELQ